MNESESKSQAYESWLPVTDLPSYFGGYSLYDPHGSLVVRLHDGDRDLVLSFGRYILGYRVFDEFAHPRYNQESSPEPTKGCPWGTEPLLIVRDSEWLSTFSDYQIAPFFGEVVHYFIFTNDRSLDILAHGEPEAHWESTASNDNSRAA